MNIFQQDMARIGRYLCRSWKSPIIIAFARAADPAGNRWIWLWCMWYMRYFTAEVVQSLGVINNALLPFVPIVEKGVKQS